MTHWSKTDLTDEITVFGKRSSMKSVAGRSYQQ